MSQTTKVAIIGGGLAGVEAAYQLSQRDISVTLFEMRPERSTEVHETPYLGEMVCSNSLGSQDLSSASGLLKAELNLLNSFFLRQSQKHTVPAGTSLSVDRLKLSKSIDKEIRNNPNITVINHEIKQIPTDFPYVIIATGPLTSPELTQTLQHLTERKNLFFYDATSPIIQADTIDMSRVYRASRYDKGSPDFINIPLSEDQYNTFVDLLINAQLVPLKELDKPIYYESCLPVEEIARRGAMTLAFGPLKPVGLVDPNTHQTPFAVVQLRQENSNNTLYQLVGFQTRLTWPEQKRIFSTLPGLEHAAFERYGRMHRNTYLNAPLILDPFYRIKKYQNIFICGQLCGVEGYVESIASGLTAALYLSQIINKKPLNALPLECATGALINAMCQSNWQSFAPTNFTFGLLPTLEKKSRLSKKESKQMHSQRALAALQSWLDMNNI